MSFTIDQAETVAKSLNKSMKGFGNKKYMPLFFIMKLKHFKGTDESRLIKEIVSHTSGQRQMIKDKYLAMYGKVI